MIPLSSEVIGSVTQPQLWSASQVLFWLGCQYWCWCHSCCWIFPGIFNIPVKERAFILEGVFGVSKNCRTRLPGTGATLISNSSKLTHYDLYTRQTTLSLNKKTTRVLRSIDSILVVGVSERKWSESLQCSINTA